MGMEQEPFDASEKEKELLKLLRNHPQLSERMKRIAEVANTDGAVADQVEEELIEQLRRLGNETMSSWAKRQAGQVENQMEEESPRMHRHKKKR